MQRFSGGFSGAVTSTDGKHKHRAGKRPKRCATARCRCVGQVSV